MNKELEEEIARIKRRKIDYSEYKSLWYWLWDGVMGYGWSVELRKGGKTG